MSEGQPRIPLALVTGFLGSGKTTLLRRVVERHRDRRIVYLVNEFSPLDVDGARLREGTDAVITIPGGSIFCRCRVTEFIGALQDLPARFGAPGAPVEGVVVEASGMADPRPVRALLRESRLDGTYRLSAVVAIVDPGGFLKLIHTLPAVLAQVEAADRVLVNKTDLAAPQEIEAAERAVREAAPGAVLTRTCRCDVDLDLFGEAGGRDAGGELAACADPGYAHLALRFDGDTDVEDIRGRVAAMADDIYRVKGFVRAGGRLLSVDYSHSGFEVEEGPGRGAAPELVFVVRGPARLRVMGGLSGVANATVRIEGGRPS